MRYKCVIMKSHHVETFYRCLSRQSKWYLIFHDTLFGHFYSLRNNNLDGSLYYISCNCNQLFNVCILGVYCRVVHFNIQRTIGISMISFNSAVIIYPNTSNIGGDVSRYNIFKKNQFSRLSFNQYPTFKRLWSQL